MTDADLSKSEEIRFRVMRMVADNQHITQRELSAKLGISLGRTNYCLRALIDKGLVKIDNFKASNTKWRYAYVLTPSGIAEKAAMTSQFLARKIEEFEALSAEIAALQTDISGAKPEQDDPEVARTPA